MKNWKTLWKTIDDGLKDMNREDLWKSSIMYPKSCGFTRLLSKIQPETVVEIGTYRGLSTVILALMCKKVYTYDIIYQEDTKVLWDYFGVNDKIEYLACSPQMDFPIPIEDFVILLNRYRPVIKKHINKLGRFDLALIDGLHTYKDVKKDFNMVKKCGRVLFHDWRDSFPGIGEFMEEIGAKRIGEFGYWEKQIR
jgi:hypothetical protein